MPINYKVRERCQCGAEIEYASSYSQPDTWAWKIHHARGCIDMFNTLTSAEKETIQGVNSI